MKRLWIAAGLLCVVVGLCTVTTIYQHRRAEDMLALVDAVEEAYRQGDIPAARQAAQELLETYDSACRIMMCFTAHSDMAESQETVRLLPTLLQANGGEELGMEIARLREELTHLRNVDDPLLWNIL